MCKWLVNSRHVVDNDHMLYETTRVHTYKGDTVCDRLRVDHVRILVSHGYDGAYHGKFIMSGISIERV